MRLSATACAGFAAACAGDVAVATADLTDVLASAEQARIVFVQAVASATLAATRAMAGDLDRRAPARPARRFSSPARRSTSGAGSSDSPPVRGAGAACRRPHRRGSRRAPVRAGSRALQRNLRRRRTRLRRAPRPVRLPRRPLGRRRPRQRRGGKEPPRGRIRPSPRTGRRRFATLIAAARGERLHRRRRSIVRSQRRDRRHRPAVHRVRPHGRSHRPTSAGRCSKLVSSVGGRGGRSTCRASGRQSAPKLVSLSLEIGDGDAAREVAEDLRVLAGHAPSIRPLAVAALRVEGLVEGSPEPPLAAVGLEPRGQPSPLRTGGGVSKTPASSWPRTTPNAPGSSSTVRPRHARRHSTRDATPPASSTACRAAGLRPRSKRSSRPRFGWEALTPTELRVVDEVAHGRTQRGAGHRHAHLRAEHRRVPPQAHLRQARSPITGRGRPAPGRLAPFLTFAVNPATPAVEIPDLRDARLGPGAHSRATTTQAPVRVTQPSRTRPGKEATRGPATGRHR